MIIWDLDARKIKKITNHIDEPVYLYHVKNKGYVLSDGWLTDWLNEPTFIIGSTFSIDNLFHLTSKQLEQVEKSFLHDKLKNFGV